MADPRAIHEFLTGEVEATTLLLGDFVDLDAQSGYTTYKASVSDIGEVILEDIEYTQDLQTTDKTIIGAINENKSVIGYSYDEYDPTTAYAKDDLCIYNNTLYKAKQATTGNLPTNTTYWEETSIADEIDVLKSDKADKSNVSSGSTNSVSVPAYTATNLHSVNVTAGNYIVSCSIEFSSANTTGTRRIGITTSNNDVAASEMAAFNGYAAMNVSGAFKATTNTTVNFFCRHSADAALPVKIVAWSIVKVD